MTTLAPPLPVEATAPPRGVPAGRLHRLIKGRPDDPAWIRPGLLGLLALTAVLYIWGLGAEGWANSFYAAAVQAGTKSWEAFLFGSSDASNFITVDKPPASLWVMEISARIFGLNSWSLLVPQALEGVAAVGVLYLAVRRALSPAAGLMAGAVLALTPIAALMFRYDNPDSLLVLVLVGAVYAATRYLDAGKLRWIAAAGALIGVGFITKSLQAIIIVPVLAAVVLFLGAAPLRRRLLALAVGAAGMIVAGGWWIAIVVLTPAADRPYIGGSQDNSIFNVIFGYNGFGRLTGNETGSVTGGGTARGGQGVAGHGAGAANTSMWGPTGITRMFNSAFGGQISWLLPAALVLLVAGLWLTIRAARTDRTRAGLVLWGGWLIITGLVFSLSKGIIHPYYTVALAPALAAVVGIGVVLAWRSRAGWTGRGILAVSVGVTAVWAWVLLDRSPSWHPWLRVAVIIVGLASALALLVGDRVRPGSHWLPRSVAGVAMAACLAGPLAYTLSTVATSQSGAIPSAGPTVAGGFGGGGFGGGGFAGRSAGRGFAGARAGGAGGPGSFAGGRPPTGAGAGSGARAGGGSAFPGGGSAPTGGGAGLGRSGYGGGTGGGGLLGSSTVDKAVKALLEENAGRYTWVAATTGSENASGYQLATDDPVMSIGGFNGTDPAPSLAQFERYVSEGKIHWYIGGQSMGGNGGSGDASAIAAWVKAHFVAKTVDGVTLYDLTTK